jgi:hypothetical protein
LIISFILALVTNHPLNNVFVLQIPRWIDNIWKFSLCGNKIDNDLLWQKCVGYMLRYNKNFPYSYQNICCMLHAPYKFKYQSFQTWSILKTSGLRNDQMILHICKCFVNGKHYKIYQVRYESNIYIE